jgi:hypothetical protein
METEQAYRLRIRNWAALYENNRTRELVNLNWVPIPNRMDGDSYTELVDHPEAISHYAAWISIVCIASRQTPRGTLPREGAGIPQALARISRFPVSVFESVIPRLVQMGWLECFQGVMSNTAGGCEIVASGCGIPAGRCDDLASEGKGIEGNRREKNKSETALRKRSAQAIGSRLLIEQPTPEMEQFCVTEMGWIPGRVQATWATFHDYWISCPGSKGVKTDWLATWRNWCRRENEKSQVVVPFREVQQRESATERAIREAKQMVMERGFL